MNTVSLTNSLTTQYSPGSIWRSEEDFYILATVDYNSGVLWTAVNLNSGNRLAAHPVEDPKDAVRKLTFVAARADIAITIKE